MNTRNSKNKYKIIGGKGKNETFSYYLLFEDKKRGSEQENEERKGRFQGRACSTLND